MSVSVNTTIEDLTNTEVIKCIDSAMHAYGCAPCIIFEITESEEIKEYDNARNFIKLAKGKYGSNVTIDDFDSDYSNFEHLLELDFYYLKIDG